MIYEISSSGAWWQHARLGALPGRHFYIQTVGFYINDKLNCSLTWIILCVVVLGSQRTLVFQQSPSLSLSFSLPYSLSGNFLFAFPFHFLFFAFACMMNWWVLYEIVARDNKYNSNKNKMRWRRWRWRRRWRKGNYRAHKLSRCAVWKWQSVKLYNSIMWALVNNWWFG